MYAFGGWGLLCEWFAVCCCSKSLPLCRAKVRIKKIPANFLASRWLPKLSYVVSSQQNDLGRSPQVKIQNFFTFVCLFSWGWQTLTEGPGEFVMRVWGLGLGKSCWYVGSVITWSCPLSSPWNLTKFCYNAQLPKNPTNENPGKASSNACPSLVVMVKDIYSIFILFCSDCNLDGNSRSSDKLLQGGFWVVALNFSFPH